MDRSQTDHRAVTMWLQQNAIPLRTLEPGSGFDDLDALRPLLDNVKVVGLGESTHGTHEFFLFKHRMIEFLVLEMDFTVFTMEASFAAGHAINDYVLQGTGHLDTALSGLGYIAWDTEEILTLLNWLRDYNQSLPDERRVRFYGLDYTFNEAGRQEVRTYLESVASDWAARIEPTFRVLAKEEAKWPMHVDDESRQVGRRVVPELQGLIDFLDTRKGQLTVPASIAQLDRIIRLCRVMLERATFDDNTRSQHMGKNLIALMANDIADRKVVYWGHNYHVGVETFPGKPPTCGHVLREQYGETYIALALEYGQGTYQARSLGPDRLADLQVVTIPPAPEGTLPWYLDSAGIGDSIVMLREPIHDPAIEEWLASPLLAHAMGWVTTDPESEYERAAVYHRYDGIVFTAGSTPVNPTESAKNNASRGVLL